MNESATKSFESPSDRRFKLVFHLAEELQHRGYNFFNFDGSPRETPDLRNNEFEFARTIKKLPNSGFFWKDKNYSVQIAGKFKLEDPYQVKAEIKGKDEIGNIERLVGYFNDRYSLSPGTKFEVKLKSPDYEIWTSQDYRNMIKEGK